MALHPATQRLTVQKVFRSELAPARFGAGPGRGDDGGIFASLDALHGGGIAAVAGQPLVIMLVFAAVTIGLATALANRPMRV